MKMSSNIKRFSKEMTTLHAYISSCKSSHKRSEVERRIPFHLQKMLLPSFDGQMVGHLTVIWRNYPNLDPRVSILEINTYKIFSREGGWELPLF